MKDKKHTIGVVFKIEGGNADLIEKFVYENTPNKKQESIDILSSATVESNLMGFINKNAKLNEKQLKVFSAPCILVARNGFAGTMKYIEKGQFTTNDHAYVMTLKPGWNDKVNLRWFMFQYQELFYDLTTSKSDNAVFSKEYAIKKEIIFPDITIQDSIANHHRLLIDLKEKIQKCIKLLTDQIQIQIEIQGKPKVIDNVFSLTVGSDDQMTEKYAYDNSGDVPIYSGAATNNGLFQYTNQIDYNPTGEYITWSISGKAGKMYLRTGPCCLTRDCGIMIPKNKDEVNLEWFVLSQEKKLQEFAIGKEGLGRLKKIYIKLYPFTLPPKPVQDEIVEEYSKIIELRKKLENINLSIINRFDTVVTAQI